MQSKGHFHSKWRISQGQLWGCENISQPNGNFAAHFDAWSIFVAILKLEDHFVSILNLGDHFVAISKFGNHLATKWEFRSPFFKLEAFLQQGVDFAEEGNFCSPFRSCEMGVRVLQSGTRVPKGGFEAAKHPSKGGHGCEIKKIPALALRGLSSNGHNFFISNPNRTPFEALDS